MLQIKGLVFPGNIGSHGSSAQRFFLSLALLVCLLAATAPGTELPPDVWEKIEPQMRALAPQDSAPGGPGVQVTAIKSLVPPEGGSISDYYSTAADGDVIVIGQTITNNHYTGAAYIFERNHGGANQWGQVKKIMAADAVEYAYFGYAVDVAGDVIAVGAYGRDSYRGAAYVFERNQGGANAWGQVKKLLAADGAQSHRLGKSVAVDGDVIAVGATEHDAVYVFERNQGGQNAWGQARKLTADPYGFSGDQFGKAVAVAGETILVGAPFKDTERGGAYLFARNSGGTNAWGMVKNLLSPCAEYWYFGDVVALSGDMALVGTSHRHAGAAYLYARQAGGVNGWGLVKELSAPGASGSDNDNFGQGVALWGDCALVGAPDQNSRRGAAYVFDRHAGGTQAWGQIAEITPSSAITNSVVNLGLLVAMAGNSMVLSVIAPQRGVYVYELSGRDFSRNQALPDPIPAQQAGFGNAAAAWGDVAVVGAMYAKHLGQTNVTTGAAFVFQRDSGGANAWGMVKRLESVYDPDGNEFGASVAAWGDFILVGEPKVRSTTDYTMRRGMVHVFERDKGGPNNWGVLTLLSGPNTNGVLFGAAVGLAGDVAVVGAPGWQTNTGAAFVYERSYLNQIDAWREVASLSAPGRKAGDEFGCAVSAWGDVVVVGASCHATNRGSAFVYERNAGGTNAWGRVATLSDSQGKPLDYFGQSVAVAGDVALVGAQMTNVHGAAFVYERNFGGINTWGLARKIEEPDLGRAALGGAVALDGDLALVGAYAYQTNTGAVVLYGRNVGGTNAWGKIQTIYNPNPATSDYFGLAMALSGDVALIGSPFKSNLTGAAYLFERSGLAAVPGSLSWLLLLLE